MKLLNGVGLRTLSSLQLALFKQTTCIVESQANTQQQLRFYAAKKSTQLTEAQKQFQKHTAELGFREKTSIRGTLFEFHDVDTSIKYMQSEG